MKGNEMLLLIIHFLLALFNHTILLVDINASIHLSSKVYFNFEKAN